VYSLWGVGASPYRTGYVSTLGGIGGHVQAGKAWFDLEGVAQTFSWRGIPGANDDDSPLVTRLRVYGGIDVLDHFAPFAGLSFNLAIPFTEDARLDDISPVPMRDLGDRVMAWPGVFAGIQI
jgi:hypothetical protein